MQNLSHASYSSRMLQEKKGAFTLFAALFFFIIALASYAGLYFINASQDQTQQKFIEQIKQKAEDLRPKVLDEIFALQKKLQTASRVINSHQFASKTFTLLERITHPRVRFLTYAFSPQEHTVSLTGEADDYSALGRQIAFLEGDAQINKVEFGGISLDETSKRVKFTLAIYLMPTVTVASP